MVKNISILGSTGSIGTQTLDVIREIGGINVCAVTANNNIELLEKQIREFKPDIAAVMDCEKAEILKERTKDCKTDILSGMDGIIAAAVYDKSDTVLTSVVGNIGILPTFEAIKAGKDIALANKETLVSAGELIMNAVNKYGVKIYPVDSEHSAIFQCLQGNSENKIRRILLTASGGPFRGRNAEELKNVKASDALKHPNWNMGKKVTIDSASLMNKGLEVIEAVHLFGVTADKIEVLVHRQSILHSAVELCDGAVIAQLGTPDMRLPIQYALTYPERADNAFRRLSLTDIGTLTFEKPDTETFKCLPLCIKAINEGGLAPTAVNGANEEAVALFLQGKIRFLQIADLVEKALEEVKNKRDFTLEDIFETDKAARKLVRDSIF